MSGKAVLVFIAPRKFATPAVLIADREGVQLDSAEVSGYVPGSPVTPAYVGMTVV
jgi:hypothetical protein